METITTATSYKGSKKGAVIQDSSYGVAQSQNSSHPEAPITWEVTHGEASHSVATQHKLGRESAGLYAPRLWQP